jgi:hypothetical protein
MAGEITGYRAIDGTANYYIPYLRTADQAKLRKELKRNADRLREHGGEGLKDRHNLLHKLREVILGGFLAKRGYSVEYEREFTLQVDGREALKTPDWTICSADAEVLCIVELANFHGDVRHEESFRGTPTNAVPYPPPTSEAQIRKLYSVLEGKCLAYKELANSLGVPYVVAVELEFVVSGDVEPDDVRNLLHESEFGLFIRFPEVSGLIHFADADGYRMRYEPNPTALRPIVMPQGFPTA